MSYNRMKLHAMLMMLLSLGLFIVGCAGTKIVITNANPPTFSIQHHFSEDASKGIIITYDETKTRIKEVRILYCTPPKQDVFKSANIDASFTGEVKDQLTMDAATKIATESRRVSNHTNTSILVDYAMYRVCELLVSGQVNASEADKLLGTILSSATEAYKAGADPDSAIEEELKKFFNRNGGASGEIKEEIIQPPLPE